MCEPSSGGGGGDVGAGGKLTPLCRLKTHPFERWAEASGGLVDPGLVVVDRAGEGGVLDVERWAELRREHFVRGVGIKELARRYGVDRNTVRRALRSDAPPRYQRPAAASKLDPFKPEIHRLLSRIPSCPGSGSGSCSSRWDRRGQDGR